MILRFQAIAFLVSKLWLLMAEVCVECRNTIWENRETKDQGAPSVMDVWRT